MKCDKCDCQAQTVQDYCAHICVTVPHSLDQPCGSNCNDCNKVERPLTIEEIEPIEEARATEVEMPQSSKKKCNYKCQLCNRGFIREKAYSSHIEWCANRQEIALNNIKDNIPGFVLAARAFNKFLTYEKIDVPQLDVHRVFIDHLNDIEAVLRHYLVLFKCIKFDIVINAHFSHPIDENTTIEAVFIQFSSHVFKKTIWVF